MSVKSCVIDNSHNQPKLFTTRNGTDIYVCDDCGCIMANINFLQEQYESDIYYTMVRKTKQEIDGEWGFRWRYILSEINKEINPSTLLDVGAGNGYFVDVARKEFGFDATGLEISSKEIDFAKKLIGVDLINEDVTTHQRKYKVVTSLNVLEHVKNPRLHLINLIERLDSEGILILTTPNPVCIHARIHGLKNWGMIAPPHHINLFTRKALGLLLEENNLKQLKYNTLSTYINFVRNIDTKGLLLRKFFFYVFRAFNLGADHFIIAQKNSNNQKKR